MRSVLALVVLGLPAEQAAAEGQSYAFLVGVADYDKTQLNPLQYTSDDILEFQKALIESGLPAENIVLLADGQKARYLPESKKIRVELDLLLSGVEDEDSLIVAMAGHGIQFTGERKSYFCPLDADLADKQTLIALDELYQRLADCPAKRKLLLVDACRNDPQSSLGRSRATINLESVSRPQSEAVPEGIVALFSCGAGQRSFEDPEIKHGIFFYHVLQGWRGQADENKDGKLTFDELTGYTRLKTQTYARLNLKVAQTPHLRSDFSGVWNLREFASLSRPRITNKPVMKREEDNLKPGSVIRNSIGMELALIPAGEFEMGSPPDEADRTNAEGPVHKVRITKPFYMGRTEVTQGQWERVMGTLPWSGQQRIQAGTNNAASFVSYEDALQFCGKLTAMERTSGQLPTNSAYRLPTEAEWEYACRAGSKTRFAYGNDQTQHGLYAWCKSATSDVGEAYAHEVAKMKPNAWGLFDMHGNVWEWCQDWYGADYYTQSPRNDPQGPSTGTARVDRGGGWLNDPPLQRSAYRGTAPPHFRINLIGFRVVVTAKEN